MGRQGSRGKGLKADGGFSAPRYLLQNMDWLEEELGGYDDDYLIFDCPGTGCPVVISSIPKLTNRFVWIGQIELYTHHPFLPTLVQNLSRMGIRTCAVYLLESQFMEDRYKFFRCGSVNKMSVFSSS